MPITADDLKARIDGLEQQKQAALSTASACDGAIQDCLYWLQQLATAEEAEAKPTTEAPGD